jgi:formamidopyrimidine-DNA glycosylase
MPELPEVETTRRGIEPHVSGKKVRALIVRDARLRWPVPPDLAQRVQRKTITGVRRRGKYLLIDVATGAVIVHLGMSGSLRVCRADEPPRAHDHIDLQLTDGTCLRYHDPRRFGCWLWLPKGESHALLDVLGPEPLQSGFDGNYLFEQSRGRKVSVKSFIMDSHIVVGVGNIYANEALFMAGILPSRAAGRINRERYLALADCIRQVLGEAITQGGTTLRDFVGGDGKPGYFQQKLFVYGRGGEACRTCKLPLTESRLGQRSTVFCRQCQR